MSDQYRREYEHNDRRRAGQPRRSGEGTARPRASRQQASGSRAGERDTRAPRQQGGRYVYDDRASWQERQEARQRAESRAAAGSRGRNAGAGQRVASMRPATARNAGTRAASYNRARSQADRGNPQNAAVYRDYARYTQRKRRPTPVLIGVLAAVVIAAGVGLFLLLNPPTFEVTINGAPHTVNNGATLNSVLDEGLASPKAGNLVAVDNSVIEEGKGDRFSATVNDEETNDGTLKLKKNDVVQFGDGADVSEDFTATTEEVPFERVEDDNYWSGSIHVYIPGQNGVRTTKTGTISGKTVTEDTTPVVNEEYKIYTANTGDDKVIALTFDDGPWPGTTEEILDVLAQNDAKATFFTIGNQVAEHADTVKKAYEAGNQICTHTWDHAAGSGQGVNMTYMSKDEQIAEVEKGFEAVDQAVGEKVSRVMRAPGGNFKGDVVWNVQPYITAEIGWNEDTEDWRRPGAEAIAQQILKAKPGNVVLMHDGGGDRSQTVEALKIALPQLKEQGYRFITIDELLAYGVPESK